jgi:hypothetical protein
MDAVFEAMLLLVIVGLLTVLGTRELRSSVVQARSPLPGSKPFRSDDAA